MVPSWHGSLQLFQPCLRNWTTNNHRAPSKIVTYNFETGLKTGPANVNCLSSVAVVDTFPVRFELEKRNDPQRKALAPREISGGQSLGFFRVFKSPETPTKERVAHILDSPCQV
jgi:hypothetical protein